MARRTVAAQPALARDARNRALRSALQSAAAAGAVALLTAAAAWLTGGTFDVDVLKGAVATAVVVPIAALIHRLYVDPSGLPSATPPTDTVAASRRRRRAAR